MSIDHLPSDVSVVSKPAKFSIPSARRGLLEYRHQLSPGPTEYSPERLAVLNEEPAYKMPKASRDISFAKYSSLHKELVTKGLY